jgi:hypothetical protein
MRTLPLFPEGARIELHVTLEWSKKQIAFDWKLYQTERKLAHGTVRYADRSLQWRITADGEVDNFFSLLEPTTIEVAVDHVKRHLPVAKRIGQERVVEIYNLVQEGTLQAHLLEILQEKLNLFDLIIGETGLILGDRFMSEDFEEEIFRRWQSSDGDVAGAFQTLGEELSRGRSNLEEIKRLDETLFAHDYESI